MLNWESCWSPWKPWLPQVLSHLLSGPSCWANEKEGGPNHLRHKPGEHSPTKRNAQIDGRFRPLAASQSHFRSPRMTKATLFIVADSEKKLERLDSCGLGEAPGSEPPLLMYPASTLQPGVFRSFSRAEACRWLLGPLPFQGSQGHCYPPTKHKNPHLVPFQKKSSLAGLRAPPC